MSVRVGLNVHPDDDFRALLPLVLADETVDALEWSWELGSPAWLPPLVDLFAAHDALTVHLVQYALNGDDTRLTAQLQRIRSECAQRKPRHLTAHYGVLAAEGFTTIAPVPVVPSRAAAHEARDRLARLRDAAGCPVGVENLGIAFCADDVRRQAEMLHAILEGDRDHFLLLDVHNLYCQAENYGFAADQILALYPLERVRELHVSGGSWWEVPAGTARFRRDTHDQAVPSEVLALLETTLRHAPNLELVCFERMGGHDRRRGRACRGPCRLPAGRRDGPRRERRRAPRPHGTTPSARAAGRLGARVRVGADRRAVHRRRPEGRASPGRDRSSGPARLARSHRRPRPARRDGLRAPLEQASARVEIVVVRVRFAGLGSSLAYLPTKETNDMARFMMIFRGGGYADGKMSLSPTELQAHLGKWNAWSQSMLAAGQQVGGHPLTHPPSGQVVRGREHTVTDGPYAETKDLVSGIVIVEVDSLEEATKLAHGCPILDTDGSVEVRPMMTPPTP